HAGSPGRGLELGRERRQPWRADAAEAFMRGLARRRHRGETQVHARAGQVARAVDQRAVLLPLVQRAAEHAHRTPQVGRLHRVVVELPGLAFRTRLGRGGEADGAIAHAAVDGARVGLRYRQCHREEDGYRTRPQPSRAVRRRPCPSTAGDAGAWCATASGHGIDLRCAPAQEATSMPSAVMRYSTGSTATPLALSSPRCSACAGVSCLRVSTPCTTAVPAVSFGISKSWSPNITRAALPLSSSIIQQPLAWQTSVMRPLNRCARSAWASKAPIASDTGTVAPPGTGLPYGVGVDAPAAAADSSRNRVGSRRMACSLGRVGHDSAKPAALALACGSACCWNANVSDWSHLIRDVPDFPKPGIRSEEHTSELQSRENLVCRLLLEKKNRGT